MDVSSLYTNIPQEEGTEIVCKAYDSFHNYKPPIPTRFLRQMLGLILNENSFQFNGENYLQTHGTAMGTKMAVSFANILINADTTKRNQAKRMETIYWRQYTPHEESVQACHSLTLSLLTLTRQGPSSCGTTLPCIICCCTLAQLN